jgi:FtsH-binding integral membrane protein
MKIMAIGPDARTVTGAHARPDIDEGLRQYMLRVYNYMTAGLAITGLTAFVIAQMSIVTNSAGEIIALTDLGTTLFTTPLRWVVMLAPLGMVFFLSARLHRMSLSAAQITFWLFASLMGVSLAFIFIAYTGASVTRVFFITAGTFAATSLYGYTTKRDLTRFGSFMIMGVIGIFIAMVVNIFLQSTALQFAISVIGVLLFVGLTAYDTQRIKTEYWEGDDHSTTGRKAISGALRLYLDFINLFLFLLRLLGTRR